MAIVHKPNRQIIQNYSFSSNYRALHIRIIEVSNFDHTFRTSTPYFNLFKMSVLHNQIMGITQVNQAFISSSDFKELHVLKIQGTTNSVCFEKICIFPRGAMSAIRQIHRFSVVVIVLSIIILDDSWAIWAELSLAGLVWQWQLICPIKYNPVKLNCEFEVKSKLCSRQFKGYVTIIGDTLDSIWGIWAKLRFYYYFCINTNSEILERIFRILIRWLWKSTRFKVGEVVITV